MFYTNKFDSSLRFGDIVKGFINVVPSFNDINEEINNKFNIGVEFYQYFAVLTPCCSIEEKTILLTPLKQIDKRSIFQNSFFKQDFSRINVRQKQINHITKKIFDKMHAIKQTEILNSPDSYPLKDIFIYLGEEILDNYQPNIENNEGLSTSNYMISFRDIFKVNCKLINRGAAIPEFIKYAQLSINTRDTLREKLIDYFARNPDEDIKV